MIKKFRINPSLLISMVALFVALGGVSYAAATISSAQVKNNTIRSVDVRNGDLRGKDLKKDTIGGSRVLESSLGQVPSAANADNATKAQSADTATSAQSAANADTLDGVDSTGFVRVKTRVRSTSDAAVDNYGDNANLLQLSNLAAGQYTVMAKLHVDNDGGADEVIDCDLMRSSNVVTQLDSSEQDLGANAGAAQELNYALIGTFTAAAAGTDDLFLRCEQQGDDNDAGQLRIIATLIN